MKYKFKVGQVVNWEDRVWEITSHYRMAASEVYTLDNFYTLKYKDDPNYEVAEERDLRPLTKKQVGR